MMIMRDIIYRDDAINVLEKLSACKEYGEEIGTEEETYIGKYEAITELSDLPSADEQQVDGATLISAMALGYSYGIKANRPQGEWLDIGTFSHSYKCSVCGRTLFNITVGKNHVAKYYPYCHCGARMFTKDTDVLNKKRIGDE